MTTQTEAIEAYARKIVSELPPLTSAQLGRIAVILRPANGGAA